MNVSLPAVDLLIYSTTSADNLKTKLKLSKLQLDFIEKLSKFLVSPFPCSVTFFTSKSISNYYQINLILPHEILDINDVGSNISHLCLQFGRRAWDCKYVKCSTRYQRNNNNNNILYLDTLSREETLFKGVYIGTIIGYTN